MWFLFCGVHGLFLNAGGEELGNCALCVCSCLENKHYQLALKICDHAILCAAAKEDLHTLDILTFYQAKALFGIYSREEVLLRMLEKKIPHEDFFKLGEDVFRKPRKIAGSLSSLLTKGSLGAAKRKEETENIAEQKGEKSKELEKKEEQKLVDKRDEEKRTSEQKEAEQLLDTVLMDLIRELNCESGQQAKQTMASKKKGRAAFPCLLCHRYDALVQGHFFPHSMLKATQVKRGQRKVSSVPNPSSDLSSSLSQKVPPTSGSDKKGLEVVSTSSLETPVPGALLVEPKEQFSSGGVGEDKGPCWDGRALKMTAVRVGDSETFARVCGDADGLLVQPSAGKSTKEIEAISSVDENDTELKASASVDEKGKRPTTIPSIGEGSVAGRKSSSKKLSEKKYTSFKSPEETKFVVTMASERRKRPGLKSSAAAVFYMSCDHCDNEVLSRDEKAFSEQILSQTYSDALPGLECFEHRLEYDDSLYRFCAGLVLRALAIQRGVSKCTNSARIYRLFKQCRALLSEPDGLGINKGDLPQLAMFFTPVREPMFAAAESGQHNMGDRSQDDAGVEHSSIPPQHDKPKSISSGNDAKDLPCSMSTSENPSQPNSGPLTPDPTGIVETAEPVLRHFFESNTFSKLSHTPLLDSVPDVVRRGHFLDVHCGIFSIVLLIEPVASLPAKYGQFLIRPEGGCLHVPVNDQRMSHLPLGMTMLYRESVARAAKNMLEMAKQVGPADAVFNRVRRIRIDEVTESDAGLIQALEEGAAYQPCCVSYLPAQYSVDFCTNRVVLPPCDRVLLHGTLQSDEETGLGFTVLLAVHEDHGGKMKPKPYAIVCHFSQHSNLCLGFYLDTSGEKYAFESYLHEPYSKMILEELHPKQDAKSPHETKMDGHSQQESKEKINHFLLNIPSVLLPQALSNAGVSSFESLLTHSPR